MLDPAELAPSVYLALLRSAEVYVIPDKLPYGRGPLKALSTRARIHAVRSLHDEIPEDMHGRVTWIEAPAAVVAGATGHARADAGAARRAPNPAPLPTPETGSPFGEWWAGLGRLQPEPGEIRTAEPAPQRPPSRDTARLPGEAAGNNSVRLRDRATADFAVLTCCYKYLQRFRVFLDSIARQDYPQGRIEICVAAPGNPDGLFEYLALFRKAHPALAVVVVDVPEAERINRGKMINAAFRGSTAPVVMVADGDLVLPPRFVRDMLEAYVPDRVLGCWRTPLSAEATAHIVTGNADPLDLFDQLRGRWDAAAAKGVRQGVLGYCQIVSREAFEHVRYPEEFNCINQSDIVFIERLKERLGIEPRLLEEQFVLHLDHARDWSGTKIFL
jgi:hypothetical protein